MRWLTDDVRWPVALLLLLLLLLLLAAHALAPLLMQHLFALEGARLGLDSHPHGNNHSRSKTDPFIDSLSVDAFAPDSVSLSLSLRVPLPHGPLPLPSSFMAGVQAPATATIAFGATRIAEATLSDDIILRGQDSFLRVRQDTLLLRFAPGIESDNPAFASLIRKVVAQAKTPNLLDGGIMLTVSLNINIHVMGIVLWTNVPLSTQINASLLIDKVRKDIAAKQAAKALDTRNPVSLIPPAVIPTEQVHIPPAVRAYNALPVKNRDLTPAAGPLDLAAIARDDVTRARNASAPGPLDLVGIAAERRRKEVEVAEAAAGPWERPSGMDGMLPDPRVERLPAGSTATGTLRAGLRVSFTHPPSLHLQLHRVDFDVLLNGEHAARGSLLPFRVDPHVAGGATDLVVEVTPSVLPAAFGGRGVLRGVVGGARGVWKGFVKGALSGFSEGGEFGDGATVVTVQGVKVSAFGGGGNVVEVKWLDEVLKHVDLRIEVNPVKAVLGGVGSMDGGVVVELVASLVLMLMGL
ncbi:hypothetical protein BC830DRAFT_1087600 [Chytriomyces sp. MP71]|nr:hypothetical protein BC830DRAFT_1087600 [Chytriomyces sp. MP71]